ncbi:hypothetical protein [Spirosoma sp. 209]|uniref:hypothetical protein n=1 Tax=Spirosoma sp. 209 TaxID=1955701 RepID=UPI00098CF569|nr:hypothetical protein [Spirosoma sp. 209]
MAYGLRYQYSFLQAIQTEALAPARYRVSIYRKDYTGPVTELLPGAKPLVIRIDGSRDSRFEPFAPTEIKLSLLCQDYWEAEDLYASEEDTLKVIVARVNDFTGLSTALYSAWVQPTDLKTVYGPKPFPVQLSATCGLSLLKDRQLLGSDSKRLTGSISELAVITNALLLTGHDLPVNTAFNLFNVVDLGYIERDPLARHTLNAETFVNDDFTLQTAYEAIERILLPIGARVKQWQNEWWVVRANELAGGFDPLAASPTPTTTRVRREGSASRSIDFNVTTDRYGALRVLEGAKPWLTPTAPGVLIKQSFGRYLSNLPNADFSQVDSTGLPVGWATNNLQTQNRFRTGTGLPDDLYRLVIYDAGDNKFNKDTPYVAKRVQYTPDSKEYKKFIKRSFKGEFRLTNLRSAKFAFLAERDDEIYFYKCAPGSSSGAWTAMSKIKSNDMYGALVGNVSTINGVQKTKPGWASFNIDLGTLDKVKSLIVCLCMGESLDQPEANVRPKIEYQNIKLVTEEEGFELNGTEVTIVKPGKRVKNATVSLTLGYIPDAGRPTERTGALFYTGSGASKLLYRAGANPLAPTGPNDAGKSLIQWLAEDYARQLMYPANVFEGTLVGDLPYGPLTVLRVEDIGPKVSNVVQPIAHQITGWEWDVRTAQHTVTAVEMLTSSALTLPDSDGAWQTPNGTIPFTASEEGEILEPAEQVKPRLEEILLGKMATLGGVQYPTLQRYIPGTVPITGPANQRPMLQRADANGQPVGPAIGPVARSKVNLDFLDAIL